MTSIKWPSQVARAMHEYSNAAPAAPTVTAIRQRQAPPAREPRMALTLVAAAVILATAVGVTFVVRGDDSASVSEPSVIDVHHARIEVTLTAELECETQVDTAGTFATMVVDSYSDREGRRWRTRVTYPDASTVDSIVTGSAIYPTGHFQRGDYRGTAFGCIGPNDARFVLVSEPTAGGFFTMNVSDELAPDEIPFVTDFRETTGTRIGGDHVDSRGRPSELWEFRNEGGTMSYGSVTDVDVTQILNWWVSELDGDTVTEQRYSTAVETLGSGTQTLTLVANESMTVPVDFFETVGYEELETSPRPSLDGSSTDDTVAVMPTSQPLELPSAPAGLQLVGQGVRTVGGEDVRAAVFVKRDAQDNIVERVIARVGDLSVYATGDPLVVPPNLSAVVESIGYTSVDQQTRTVRVEYALGPLGLSLEAYHPDEASSPALSYEMQQIAAALDVSAGHDIGVIGPLPNGWTLATVGIEPANSVPSFYQAFEVNSTEGGPRVIIDNRMLDDPDYPYWEMSQTLESAEIRGHSGFVTTHEYFASTDPNAPTPNSSIRWTILIWEEAPGHWVTMWVANTTTAEAISLTQSLVAVEQAHWPAV